MILTDIYVPALNETYDFQLDETVPVCLLIDEIAQILQKKSGGTEETFSHPFVLCSFEQMCILDSSKTLQESGITNGGALLIV